MLEVWLAACGDAVGMGEPQIRAWRRVKWDGPPLARAPSRAVCYAAVGCVTRLKRRSPNDGRACPALRTSYPYVALKIYSGKTP